MKDLILIFMLLGILPKAGAQDLQPNEVPSIVVNAFQSRYSNATDVDWKKKGDLFKVEFEIGKRGHDLWIDKSGNITKHKEDIAKSDIPQAIAKKLQSDYKDFRIDDVDKIEENNKVYYRVELDGKPEDKQVMFLEDGSIYTTQSGAN